MAKHTGQSTPDIAAALRMSCYDMDGAFGLILDSGRDERRRAYDPYLHTHASARAAAIESVTSSRR
jgi:hypothetical protein